MITAVTLDGDALPLDKISVAGQVTHGRGSISDGPTASAASLVLIATDADAITSGKYTVGVPLTIDAAGRRRFTGVVTDLVLNSLDDQTAKLTVTGVGMLSQLGRRRLPATTYPQQTTSARVAAIAAAANQPITVRGSADSTQKARTADPTTALDALTALAGQTLAALVDMPEGTIVWQALNARGAFRDTVPLGVTALPLAATVFSPTSAQRLDTLLNTVTVTYGTNQAVTVTDEASIQKYDVIGAELATDFADLGSAQDLAAFLVQRSAFPRWQMGQVEVLLHELDTADADMILDLVSGDRLMLPYLPPPNVAESVVGVVEGWTDTYGADFHSVTFALSEPVVPITVELTLEWKPATIARQKPAATPAPMAQPVPLNRNPAVMRGEGNTDTVPTLQQLVAGTWVDTGLTPARIGPRWWEWDTLVDFTVETTPVFRIVGDDTESGTATALHWPTIPSGWTYDGQPIDITEPVPPAANVPLGWVIDYRDDDFQTIVGVLAEVRTSADGGQTWSQWQQTGTPATFDQTHAEMAYAPRQNSAGRLAQARVTMSGAFTGPAPEPVVLFSWTYAPAAAQTPHEPDQEISP